MKLTLFERNPFLLHTIHEIIEEGDNGTPHDIVEVMYNLLDANQITQLEGIIDKQYTDDNVTEEELRSRMGIEQLREGARRMKSLEEIPDVIKQRERLTYEITSLITDDINCASSLIEDMLLIYTKDQMNEMEDIIVNHYGVEHV